MPGNPLPPIRYATAGPLGIPDVGDGRESFAGVDKERLDVAWDTLMDWIASSGDTVGTLKAFSKVAEPPQVSALLANILKADDDHMVVAAIIED